MYGLLSIAVVYWIEHKITSELDIVTSVYVNS
jgi:hypothetical protein